LAEQTLEELKQI